MTDTLKYWEKSLGDTGYTKMFLSIPALIPVRTVSDVSAFTSRPMHLEKCSTAAVFTIWICHSETATSKGFAVEGTVFSPCNSQYWLRDSHIEQFYSMTIKPAFSIFACHHTNILASVASQKSNRPSAKLLKSLHLGWNLKFLVLVGYLQSSTKYPITIAPPPAKKRRYGAKQLPACCTSIE